MVSASKKLPGKHGSFGAARPVPGVVPVSKDDDIGKDKDKDKEKGAKSDVIASQDPQAAKKGRRGAPAVLDRWFDAQLSRLYADVASEPVPVEMLQLISKLKKPKQPGS